MAPLNIAIIGAGIAGLTAAIALRQQGHHIVLLEKSTFHQEAGAAVHIGANVSGFLTDIGFDFKRAGAILLQGLLRFDGYTGQQTAKVPIAAIGKEWKHATYQMLRTDLHAELKRLALDPQGKGPVPELVLGARISQIDAAGGVVELEDGRRFTGDLVIGADGLHSMCRPYIEPHAKPTPYGKGCYRFLLPTSTLLAEPEMEQQFGHDGYFGELTGVDRRMIYYPCDDNKTFNFAVFIPSEESNAEGSDYNQQGNKALLQEAFSGFCEVARKILEMAPDDLKVWDLYDMAPMTSWTSGKLALMGDAAHPGVPFLGQIGAMAIEDAESLAALLPADTAAQEVMGRLKLYEECRLERATFVQTASRMNGYDLDKRDPGECSDCGVRSGMLTDLQTSISVLRSHGLRCMMSGRTASRSCGSGRCCSMRQVR